MVEETEWHLRQLITIVGPADEHRKTYSNEMKEVKLLGTPIPSSAVEKIRLTERHKCCRSEGEGGLTDV